MAAIAPDVVVHGKMATIVGGDPQPTASLPEIGSIEVALCGYGSQVPKVAGEAIMGGLTQDIDMQALDSSFPGAFDLFLYSNGLITPPGTYYTITTKNANGDIAQVEAYYFEPGSWDLSNMQPYDPGQPPPPLPPLIIPQLLVVPYSEFPTFDGTNFTAFRMALSGDVVLGEITNMIPGNLYTFILLQDTIGGRLFGWPLNAYNAMYVSPTPSTYSIQTFVALDDGSLYAIGPGTYYTL